MLSRSITRLQVPTVLRITSSTPTVWSRSMARHNKPNNPQNKPQWDQSKQGDSQSQRPAGATPVFTSQNNLQSRGKSGRLDFSKRQDEVSKGASPERYSLPNEGSSARVPNPSSRKEEDPAFSGKQDEFDANASPSDKTAPQSTSPSSIDPAESQKFTRPLPDLTQGIPSTLEYETLDSSGNKGLPAFNLTEAAEPGEGPGGRSRGELPASAYVSSSERRRLRMANYLYATFAGAIVAGTVYLGRDWETEEEEVKHATDAPSGWAFGLFWSRAKARLFDQLNYYNEPAFPKLLPDVDPSFERPYTLVLSLEDLLIHSEWTREHGWRLAKRPGVDYFLRYLSQYYELVIFTSQPWGMAEPVLRKLDPYHIVTWPLFREATLYENGEYVKDVSYLNRDLSKVIVIDTKASHVKNQPENAIILKPWEGQVGDKDLVGLIPFLEYIHTMAYTDVRKALKSFEGTHIPTEFARREAIARKKFQDGLAEEKKKRPKHSGSGFLANALGIKPQGMMMTDPNETTASEAFAQGKMLQDLARERGQRNYEALEKEIRENGEKWLKEEAAHEEKAKEEGMKQMKSGFMGFFGSSGPPPAEPSK
ncbi:putative mitochondrial import inner membrane translocase subunit tim50 [Amylocarpus encephaloides]|uniref:Mitochondrial import inner membrane translocase subunit TIM50 n=1 Tax=Amylocarpus encephaloides TaxID=45428 RepID=A0A9P8C0I5_9HELO|nr:putative mitochondrial import inner membrane translocase subunit tim50 [Amylocarpus encephaloides]